MEYKLPVFAYAGSAFVLVSAILITTPAWAQDLRPMYKFGIDYGGDTLVTIRMTDGSTESIKANRGYFIGGGLSIINDAKDIEGEISISYKIDWVPVSGNSNWTRFPVDALIFHRAAKFRVGGGLTYHLNPKLSVSAPGGDLSISADNAMGVMLQVDYSDDGKFFSGLRYTSLEYKASNCFCIPAKSNGIGLVVSRRF